MKYLYLAAISAIVVFFAFTSRGIETTSLDTALERPVKVGKFVDKENGVVCYYIGRHPEYIDCVKVK